MTKEQLQQELKEKIKEGVKPSDLKKKRTISIPTPPDSPIITPTDKKVGISWNNKKGLEEQKKLKDLQRDIKFWEQTANNHLKNLQLVQGKIINLEEENKKLKQKPIQLNKETETALKEANQKIRDQEKENKQWQEVVKKSNLLIADKEQIIKELQSKNKQLIEKYAKLENQSKNTIKDKPNQNKGTQTEPSQKYYLFTCDICEQNKKSKLHRERVNGLGIDPTKTNKICDYCINRVDIIKNTEKEYIWE